MTEIERRLRAALHAAVDQEEPPAGLLESVMARHRRHRRRTAIAGVAIVAVGALAVPPAASAFHGRVSRPSRPAAPAPPRAAPGTVLETCTNQIGMTLPDRWRAASIAAGPLWFLDVRPAAASYYGKHRLAIGGLVVMVRDGATAWVSVAGPAAGHFRFLFGPDDFTDGVDGRYTLSDGENGVTFAGCPRNSALPDASLGSLSGYTMFGDYYLIDKVPSRVSLDVRTPASRRPTRITFLVGS